MSRPIKCRRIGQMPVYRAFSPEEVPDAPSVQMTVDEYETIKADYLKDAMSSDYNHLLCVSFDLVERINRDIGCEISDDDEIVLNQ